MSTESQQEIAAALLQLGSATLGESGGLATDRRLKPAWSGAALAAPAYPVGCTPGDNLAVHVAVTTAPRGQRPGGRRGPGARPRLLGRGADHGGRGGGAGRPGHRRGRPRRGRARGARIPGVLLHHRADRGHQGQAGAPSASPVQGRRGHGRPGRLGGGRRRRRDFVAGRVARRRRCAAGRAREAKEAGFFAALRDGVDDGGAPRPRRVADRRGGRRPGVGALPVPARRDAFRWKNAAMTRAHRRHQEVVEPPPRRAIPSPPGAVLRFDHGACPVERRHGEGEVEPVELPGGRRQVPAWTANSARYMFTNVAPEYSSPQGMVNDDDNRDSSSHACAASSAARRSSAGASASSTWGEPSPAGGVWPRPSVAAR